MLIEEIPASLANLLSAAKQIFNTFHKGLLSMQFTRCPIICNGSASWVCIVRLHSNLCGNRLTKEPKFLDIVDKKRSLFVKYIENFHFKHMVVFATSAAQLGPI